MKEEMTMVIEGYKNVIRWYPPKKFPAIKFPKLAKWAKKFLSIKVLKYTT